MINTTAKPVTKIVFNMFLHKNNFIVFIIAVIITSIFACSSPKPNIDPHILLNKRICLDPGHPSELSSGNAPYNGMTENELNWDISLLLRDALHARGATVFMTKSAVDELVSNSNRARCANTNHVDIMIRIHADAGKTKDDNGFTIYYPDQQGTRFRKTGPALDIIQKSKTMALRFHNGMYAVLKPYMTDCGVLGDSTTYYGKIYGALTGSIFSEVPVVLIEMGYLTNEYDLKLLQSHDGRQLMVAALTEGVIQSLLTTHMTNDE